MSTMYRHHVTTNDKAWQQKTNAWLVVLYSRFKRNRTLYCIVDRDAFTDKSMLAMHGGHEQFLCADQAPPSTTTRAAQAYPTSSPQRIPRPPPPPQQPPQPMQQRGLLGALMNLPIVAITGSFGLLFGAIGLSTSAAAYLGSQLLPASWYNRIRGMPSARHCSAT